MLLLLLGDHGVEFELHIFDHVVELLIVLDEGVDESLLVLHQFCHLVLLVLERLLLLEEFIALSDSVADPCCKISELFVLEVDHIVDLINQHEFPFLVVDVMLLVEVVFEQFVFHLVLLVQGVIILSICFIHRFLLGRQRLGTVRSVEHRLPAACITTTLTFVPVVGRHAGSLELPLQKLYLLQHLFLLLLELAADFLFELLDDFLGGGPLGFKLRYVEVYFRAEQLDEVGSLVERHVFHLVFAEKVFDGGGGRVIDGFLVGIEME